MTLSDFAVRHDELCVGEPQMGSVGLLPWDERIFGFPVGEYRCGDCSRVAAHAGMMRDALDRWARGHQVEICVTSVPAARCDWIALLPGLGFHFVDFTLCMTLTGLQVSRLPESRVTLRPARLADAPAAAAIAGRAFQFGRYYADARFPKALAGRRFHQWIENAIVGADERSVVFVMRKHRGILGTVTWGYILGDETKNGFSDQGTASAALAAAVERRAAAEQAPSEVDPTFTAYIRYWLKEHASRRLAPKTFQTYEDFSEYLIRHLGETRLNDLTTAQIQRVVHRLSED